MLNVWVSETEASKRWLVDVLAFSGFLIGFVWGVIFGVVYNEWHDSAVRRWLDRRLLRR